MPDEDTTQEAASDDTSTEDSTTQTEPETSPEDDKDESWDPERAKRKIGKVNSENKALRERATKAEQKAAGVDDLTKQNGDLSVANLRLEVGYELGLPLAIAQRLQGSTKEEMLTDAEALVELIAPTKRPPTNRPTESLRAGGGQSDQEPEETDLKKLGERMFTR